MPSNTTVAEGFDLYVAVSYIPLVIIACGLVGNISSFVIFTFAKELNKYSSMVFLSFIAITDTIGLFIWNLNHFLRPNFHFALEDLSVFSCGFSIFVQYVTLQASGILYSIISVDRFFTIITIPGSFFAKLPFGTRKSAYFWSFGIILAAICFNFHLLFLSGFMKPMNNNGTVSEKLVCYNHTVISLWPLWDIMQVGVYTVLPFVIMATFNTLIIYNMLKERKGVKQSSGNAAKKKKRLTMSLTTLTWVFLLMTGPGTIAFAFFYSVLHSTSVGRAVLTVLDCIMFIQQTMLFLISYLTNRKFSEIVNQSIGRVFCRGREKGKSSETTNAVSNITAK